MSYRHRPFGIRERALRRELWLRRRAHRTALAPLRHELARHRRHTAELRQYLTLLGAEILSLEEEERRLARDITAPAAMPGDAAATSLPDDGGPLADQLRTLHQYRALQVHLVTEVLSLIAPFLSSDPSGLHPKEERTWPKIHSESGSAPVGP